MINRFVRRAHTATQALVANIKIPTPFPNPFWAQPAWYIDPQNVSRNASDDNDGLVPSRPVRTWNNGVIGRYETESPLLLQPSTLWKWLSDSPADGSDPVVFTPNVVGGFTSMQSSQILVASGNLANVIPKNRAAGTLLSADLGAQAQAGMLIVNTTPGKGSVAHVIRNTGGTQFDLSQPIEPLPSDRAFASANEVDTWANGDSFALYRFTKVDLSLIQPVICERSKFGDNFFTLYQIGGLDTSDPIHSGDAACYFGDFVNVVESSLEKRSVLTRPADGGNPLFVNSALHPSFPQGLAGGSNIAQASGTGSKPWLYAGWAHGIALAGGYIDADAVIIEQGRLAGGLIGTAFIDTGVIFRIAENVRLSDNGLGVALYGPGGINVEFGRLHVDGATAAAALIYHGPTELHGGTQAYSATAANPSALNGAVPLTPAAIDAPAGPAGFGGNAFIPGGGSITTI